MAEPGRVFRNQAFEELAEIAVDVRIGVLLNDKRCGSVLNEDGQQSNLDLLRANPFANFASDFV
jgi:hypothetical protein